MATELAEFADVDDELGAAPADLGAPPESVETPVSTQDTPLDDVETPSSDSVPDGQQQAVEGGSTATPQVQTPVDKAGAAGQQTVDFSPELLSSAGMTAEQARAKFGTPDRLDAALQWRDQQLIEAGRASWQRSQSQYAAQQPPAGQQGQQPAPQPGAVPQGQAPAAQGQPQAQPNGFKPYELNLDPNQWDAETIQLFKGLNDHYSGQLAQMHEQVMRSQQMEQAVQSLLNVQVQQTQAQYVQEYESMLDQLPKDWTDVFGKGSGFKLDKQSPQLTNRIKLDESMTMLQRGLRDQGLPPMSPKELFDRALRLEFPEKHNAIFKQQIVGKAASRQSQFVSRPTSRAGRQLTGDEAAIQRANQLYQEKGLQQNMPVDEDPDPEV